MEFTTKTEATLLAIVKQKTGVHSNTRARKMIKFGKVAVNGVVIKAPESLVKAESKVLIDQSKSSAPVVEDIIAFPFETLMMDDKVVAFIKPAGLAVRTENDKLASVERKLATWCRKSENTMPFLLNKVDKNESGILLAALDNETFNFIYTKRQEITSRWYAIVEGRLSEDGHLKHDLDKNKIGILFSAPGSSTALPAELVYRVMQTGNSYSLLKVEPKTAVHNQVRAQLALHRFPIAGDKKYKAKTKPLGRLCLHLFSLKFEHPSKGKMEVKTQVPREFLNLVKQTNA
jgi:23S rRNA pseudouridine1911/1915/1917 synthase